MLDSSILIWTKAEDPIVNGSRFRCTNHSMDKNTIPQRFEINTGLKTHDFSYNAFSSVTWGSDGTFVFE